MRSRTRKPDRPRSKAARRSRTGCRRRCGRQNPSHTSAGRLRSSRVDRGRRRSRIAPRCCRSRARRRILEARRNILHRHGRSDCKQRRARRNPIDPGRNRAAVRRSRLCCHSIEVRLRRRSGRRFHDPVPDIAKSFHRTGVRCNRAHWLPHRSGTPPRCIVVRRRNRRPDSIAGRRRRNARNGRPTAFVPGAESRSVPQSRCVDRRVDSRKAPRCRKPDNAPYRRCRCKSGTPSIPRRRDYSRGRVCPVRTRRIARCWMVCILAGRAKCSNVPGVPAAPRYSS